MSNSNILFGAAQDRQKAAQKNRKNRLKSTGTSITAGTTTVFGVDEDGGKKSKTPAWAVSPDKPQRLPTETLLEDSEDDDTTTAVAPNTYTRNRREATDVSSVASLTPQPVNII